jgi:hypothetical protein
MVNISTNSVYAVESMKINYSSVQNKKNTAQIKTGQNLTVNQPSRFLEESRHLSFENNGIQNALSQFNMLDANIKEQLTYDGRPISELSSDEAVFLVDKDGYFGVAKTSARIADFVINGAGDDLERLKKGREGVLMGLKAAEKAWGGKLFDISYETMDNALKAIDDRIAELGGSIVDVAT